VDGVYWAAKHNGGVGVELLDYKAPAEVEPSSNIFLFSFGMLPYVKPDTHSC
jgi:hypothetical protein